MLNTSQSFQLAGSATQQPNTSSSSAGPSVPNPRPRPTSLQQKPSGFDVANLTNTPDSRLLTLKPLNHINAVVAEVLSVDNLPEVPDDLKTHIATYVQRARELAGKDPVMCYWCLYFAAKRGVVARTSRPWLFKLMDVLEMVKKELRDDDGVASEDAGHTYIENFALKVFSLADVEDQSGNSTRSTAKKFLAAANFFEMLTVFDAIPQQPENEEKIKYAKWKAASIARNVRDHGSDEAKASSGSKSPPPSSSERRKSDPLATSAKPPTSSAVSKVPLPDFLSSNRYLAPPPQKGASPSLPSSFGSLPPSTSNSANPSPSSVPQIPLPISPTAASNAKLPDSKPTPQANGTLADAPMHKLLASSTGNREVDEKPSSTTLSKAPVAAVPSSGRLRRLTNEGLPKAGFFASITGKMFGSRDGQVTPGAWSNQATPGTEDDNYRPPPTGEAKGNKEKASSPLSGISPPPPVDGVTHSLLGGTANPIVHSMRDDRGATPRRPSATSNSNLGENGRRPEAQKPELTYVSNAQPSVAPSRDAPTATVTRPSPPSLPEVTVISLIPDQTIPNSASGPQRPRRASEDNQQVRRDEFSSVPSRVPETENGKRGVERRGGVPSALPIQPLAFARVAALKRVHFSGSVVGGLSSDAGTSPPHSPTEINESPLIASVVESKVEPLEKRDTPGSNLRRSASDSASRKPQLLSPVTPHPTEHTSGVPQEGSTGPGMNSSTAHSRHLSDSSLKYPPALAERDSTTLKRSPKISPNELSPVLSVPAPEGRQRAHSFGQSSLIGSAGSYTTITPNRTSPRPAIPAPLPSTSPKTRPMAIPPISKTLPPIQQQQPTPSPSPPSAQPLPSPSPVSYTAVPAAAIPMVTPASTVPLSSAMETSPSFTQSKHAAAHVSTPYTRPEDLPAALAAEVMLNARKHTVYAMSALEFDDVETARKQLRLALGALETE